MNKIEKIFDSSWGVIIFYIIVALLTLFIINANNISNVTAQNTENQTYLA